MWVHGLAINPLNEYYEHMKYSQILQTVALNIM